MEANPGYLLKYFLLYKSWEPQSLALYSKYFELPSDWLLSYWESQSEGSSKKLLPRAGLWKSQDLYFLNFVTCKANQNVIHNVFMRFWAFSINIQANKRYLNYSTISEWNSIFWINVYRPKASYKRLWYFLYSCRIISKASADLWKVYWWSVLPGQVDCFKNPWTLTK